MKRNRVRPDAAFTEVVGALTATERRLKRLGKQFKDAADFVKVCPDEKRAGISAVKNRLRREMLREVRHKIDLERQLTGELR